MRILREAVVAGLGSRPEDWPAVAPEAVVADTAAEPAAGFPLAWSPNVGALGVEALVFQVVVAGPGHQVEQSLDWQLAVGLAPAEGILE